VIKKLLFLLVFCAASAIGISIAYAHTVLVGSTPAVNSVIKTLPEKISLTFAEPLLTLGSHAINEVQVIAPDHSLISTSKSFVNGSKLSNVLSPKRKLTGKFHVLYRVVAQDGHVVKGDFYFKVGSSVTGSKSSKIVSGNYLVSANATSAGVLDANIRTNLHATLRLEINFSERSICYRIDSNIKDTLAIHIHSENQKNLTISDEIFIPLRPESVNSIKNICDPEDITTLNGLYKNINNFVFMIHTENYPEGAVAGQLRIVGARNP